MIPMTVEDLEGTLMRGLTMKSSLLWQTGHTKKSTGFHSTLQIQVSVFVPTIGGNTAVFTSPTCIGF